jgi:hypothetical protein
VAEISNRLVPAAHLGKGRAAPEAGVGIIGAGPKDML